VTLTFLQATCAIYHPGHSQIKSSTAPCNCALALTKLTTQFQTMRLLRTCFRQGLLLAIYISRRRKVCPTIQQASACTHVKGKRLSVFLAVYIISCCNLHGTWQGAPWAGVGAAGATTSRIMLSTPRRWYSPALEFIGWVNRLSQSSSDCHLIG